MILLTFTPSITDTQLTRLQVKLQPLVTWIADGKIFIDTDMLAGNLGYQLGRKYTVCKTCNSLHFWQVRVLFRCGCGSYLNKEKI